MARLTKRLIDRTPCPNEGQLFLRETELPGFGIRLTKHRKTFILEKRIHGRMRRLTLGSYGPLTVEQARQQAQTYIAEILQGGDPAQARQEQIRSHTFGTFSEVYLERHGSRKKSVRNDRTMLTRYLSVWRNRKLTSIRQAEVANLHARLGARTPYAANRTLALIQKMFNLAQTWGLYHGDNPAKGIERFPEVKRERFVHRRELAQLWTALEQESNPFIRTIFSMSLLTGARRNEILSMQWADLDLSNAIWRIPITKTNRAHILPLPQAMVHMLRRLPRFDGHPYVFPSHIGTTHIVNVSKAWQRIRRRANLPDVRIHDLRRTLGSWLATDGASLPLIGKILNHTQPSTTAVYARLDLEPVQHALEANAKRMLAYAGSRDKEHVGANNASTPKTPSTNSNKKSA